MDVSSAFHVAFAVLASIGGGGLLVLALSSWLGKVWANRILESDRRRYNEELERLRGELDKVIYVHRVQFETEFRALSDIWAKLSKLRSAMGGLRPTMDVADEDPEERFKRRLRRFEEAFNAFVRGVDDQSPFYPEEIFQELSAALQIARRESISVSVDKPEQNMAWFKEGAANYGALVEAANKVSSLIRKRLHDLRVQP